MQLLRRWSSPCTSLDSFRRSDARQSSSSLGTKAVSSATCRGSAQERKGGTQRGGHECPPFLPLPLAFPPSLPPSLPLTQ
eukprot:3934550-Rhodomonas_salina.2